MAIGVSAQPGEADSLLAGKAVIAVGTAVALPTIVSDSVVLGKVKEIILQADSANSVDILVGDANHQYLRIAPGASLTLVIPDTTKLYVKPISGTAGTINWLARV